MSQVHFLSACVLAFCIVDLTLSNPRQDLDEDGHSNVVTTRDDDECGQDAGLDSFIGKWVEVDNINKEEMLDSAGVTGARREFFLAHKSVRIYKRNEDVWTVKVGITDSPKRVEVIFKLGEPYESRNLDGTHVKGVVVQIGSTLVGHYESLGPDKYAMTIVREVHGDSMIVTVLSGGITGLILYKRV